MRKIVLNSPGSLPLFPIVTRGFGGLLCMLATIPDVIIYNFIIIIIIIIMIIIIIIIASSREAFLSLFKD